MKVLIVDDHALIREAMRGVLTEVVADVVILEARDGQEALATAALDTPPDLVLLDITLPDCDGLDLLSEYRDRWPQIAIVMLSAHQEKSTITKALSLGAVGFVPKSASREVMLGAFRLIVAGGVYVPPEVLSVTPVAQPPARPPACAAGLGLTERQLEVLLLMMKGRSNKAICRALDIAEQTVKNHVTAILKALNASNRTEAVIAASALGLSTPSDSK